MQERSVRGVAGAGRLFWCDLARVTAAGLVVLIHVSAKWFENFGRINTFDWQVANALDSLARMGVPWFFMLSGYLLLGRKPVTFSSYLRRRFARILGPFLFFSALGALVAHAIGPAPASWNPLVDPTYYHLWFFYPLILLYFFAFFVTPVLTNPWIAIGVCYALVAVTGGGLVNLGIGGLGVGTEHTFAYFLYGLIGHYAGRLPADRRTGRIGCLALVGAVIALAVVTSDLSKATGHGNEQLYAYVSVPVATASVAGFIWIRTLGIRMERAVPQSARSFVALGAGYSLAVYGLHAFILALIWRACGGTFLRMGALSGIPTLVAVVGVLSIAAAAAIAWIDKRGLLLGIESSASRALSPRPLLAAAPSRAG